MKLINMGDDRVYINPEQIIYIELSTIMRNGMYDLIIHLARGIKMTLHFDSEMESRQFLERLMSNE